MVTSVRYPPFRHSFLPSVAGPRHLLIRTIKNMRNNFLFFAIYCWCTIVLWRALTGAGYKEDYLSNTEGSSVLTRFLLESRKAREGASWGLDAFRHVQGFSRSRHSMSEIDKMDEEVASNDVIGRLIFGEPSSAIMARSTATMVSNPM